MTTLSHDGAALVASDPSTGQSVRLTPAALYPYAHELQYLDANEKWQSRYTSGLAALDADGLVMLDLPGSWHPPIVRDLMTRAGIPIVDSHRDAPERVRAALSARAPGWRRLGGIPASRLARWRKPLTICLGVAGLALMAYLASVGAWAVWRYFASFGALLMEIADGKLMAVLFSPLAFVVSPVLGKLRARKVARRIRRGELFGSSGGTYLEVGWGNNLRVMRGKESLRHTTVGQGPGWVGGLLVYRYEDQSGLFLMQGDGWPLHHLPGSWSAEDAHRFAGRHGLRLEVLRLSRAEYLGLVARVMEASP